MILVDFVSAHEHDFLYLFYSYIYDGGSNLYKSLTRYFFNILVDLPFFIYYKEIFFYVQHRLLDLSILKEFDNDY